MSEGEGEEDETGSISETEGVAGVKSEIGNNVGGIFRDNDRRDGKLTWIGGVLSL